MRGVRSIFIVVLLCGGLAQAAPQSANSGRAKAKVLYESATTHYNLSEYGDALKDFKEAYRLIKDPVLLFNIAQCHRQLREFAEAGRLYRAYRREFPEAPNRREVDHLIAQMDESVADERSHQPPTGTLPGEYGPSPTPPVVEAPPPVESAPTVAPQASAASLTAAPPQRDKPIYKKGWFWGVVVGAAAVVAVGVSVGVVYGTKSDSVHPLPDVRF